MSIVSNLTDERSVRASFLYDSPESPLDLLHQEDDGAERQKDEGAGGSAVFVPIKSAAIARWLRDDQIKNKEPIKLFLRDAKYNIFYLPKGKKVLTPAEKKRAAKRIDLICRKNNDSYIKGGADKQLVASVLKYKLVLNDREAKLEREVFADYNNRLAIQALIEKANLLSAARIKIELAKRGGSKRLNKEENATNAEKGEEENQTLDERLLVAKRNRESIEQQLELHTMELQQIAVDRQKKLKRYKRLKERETKLLSPSCRWIVIIKTLSAFKIMRNFARELTALIAANKIKWKACIRIQRWYLKLHRRKKTFKRHHLDRGNIIDNLRKRLSQNSLDAITAKDLFLARSASAGLIIDFCRQLSRSLRVIVKTYVSKIKDVQRRIRRYQAVTIGRYAVLQLVFDRFVSHLRSHVEVVVTSGLGLDTDKLSQSQLSIITRKCCKPDHLRVIQAMQNADFHRFLRAHTHTFRNALRLFPGGRFHFDLELKKKVIYETIFDRRRKHKENVDLERQREADAKSFIPEISVDEALAFLQEGKDPLVHHLTRIEKRKVDDEKRIAFLKQQNINATDSKPWIDMIYSLTPQELTLMFFNLVDLTEAEHERKEKERSISLRKHNIDGVRTKSVDLGNTNAAASQVGIDFDASCNVDSILRAGTHDSVHGSLLPENRSSQDRGAVGAAIIPDRTGSLELSLVTPTAADTSAAASPYAVAPRSPTGAKPSKVPPARAATIALIPLIGQVKY